jgi:hypothetical protein
VKTGLGVGVVREKNPVHKRVNWPAAPGNDVSLINTEHSILRSINVAFRNNRLIRHFVPVVVGSQKFPAYSNQEVAIRKAGLASRRCGMFQRFIRARFDTHTSGGLPRILPVSRAYFSGSLGFASAARSAETEGRRFQSQVVCNQASTLRIRCEQRAICRVDSLWSGNIQGCYATSFSPSDIHDVGRRALGSSQLGGPAAIDVEGH